MSLAQKVAASRKAARAEQEEIEKKEAYNNRYIAKTIMKAKKRGDTAFPSNEIETLQEIALRVVAENFSLYPHLKGVEDPHTLNEIVKLTDTNLPITVTTRNITQEFYWEEKCK